MELRINGKAVEKEALEFDLQHDGNDVVLVSRYTDGGMNEEIVRFKPDGRCIAAVRPGTFHRRDRRGNFVIENAATGRGL